MADKLCTVEKLIEKLKKLPPKKVVVMSSDPEGNRFRPFSDVGEEVFDKVSWEVSSGDPKRDIDCVILWP